MKSRRHLTAFAVVGLVVLAGVSLSPTVVFEQVERVTANPFLAGGFFLVVYLIRPFFAWPTTAVAAAVGYVYGPVVGIPVALAGATMSSCVPFAGARYFGIEGGMFGRIGESGGRFFETTGDLRGIIVSRLSPVPADAISATAGLSNVSPRAFIIGTTIGEAPWMVAAVLAGSSLDSLSVNELGKNWPLIAALGLVALLLLAGPAYRHFKDN
ncbi:TVP38/TMEM64 family protein [Haladaptatus cibarius]|uniref:TVP38/TMEM64 family protein n=1 Tax=Haladaptatus cibarius TaxID=453847 RepID=UPI000AECEDA6|nr:VTT domain-containing protein [Haladaptatus cibarius]